jgi:hypothetical protein
VYDATCALSRERNSILVDVVAVDCIRLRLPGFLFFLVLGWTGSLSKPVDPAELASIVRALVTGAAPSG